MEVTVTGAEGLPSKAFISIRVGETRRQAPFSKNEVFRFPASSQKSLVLDVFEKVGTQHMGLAGIGEMPGKVQRQRLDLQRADGLPMNLGLKVQCLEEVPSPKKSPARSNRHHAAVKAKSYLEEQGVQVILQDIVQKLLAKQPEDALLFMSDYIKDKMNQAPTPSHRKKKAPELPRGYSAIPGLGESDYPGFPSVSDPSVQLPDLSKHQHAMASVLRKNPSMYARLRSLRTSTGVTLAKCLKPGVDDLGRQGMPGLMAGDAECYTVFQELFDSVLLECRGGEKLPLRQPLALNSSEVSDLPLDPAGGSVVSVRVSAARSLEGLRFATACSQDERMEVERVAARALEALAGDLEGDYFPLAGSQTYPAKPVGMSAQETVQLQEAGFVFGPPEAKALLSSGVGLNWPQARGVFASADEAFAVQVNETEHLRINVAFKGSGLKQAFSRFCLAADALSLALQQEGHGFARSERLGFLCADPCELGTALSATVTVRLPRLAKKHAELAEFCSVLRLTAVKSATCSGALDVSNSSRLGSSEVDQVNLVINGCRRLIELEDMLERGEPLPEAKSEPLPETNFKREPLPEAPKPVFVPVATAELPAAAEPEPSAEASFALVPGLGDEEYPGFPTDACPADLPGINGHFSLMAEVLKKEPSIYNELKGVLTKQGVTLAKVIKPGIDNKGHVMIRTTGLVAGDEECYSSFSPLFDKVIDLRFGSWPSSACQPLCLDAKKVSTTIIDPAGKYVQGVEIRMGRNLRELAFMPSISIESRREVERVFSKALLDLGGDLEGTYFPLAGSKSFVPFPGGMSQEDQDMLDEDQLLFREPDSSVALSSGVGRHWPDARGVFKANSRPFSAWINEEDHLKLILKQQGSDLQQAFNVLCVAESELQAKVMQEGYKFSHSERLGFLATCPANVGTNLRACMVLNLPLVCQQPGFRDFCKHLKLQVRNIGGVFSGAGLWEVSNINRLGSSEADQVNDVINGCKQLISLEEQLERGEPVVFADLLAKKEEEEYIAEDFGEFGEDEEEGEEYLAAEEPIDSGVVAWAEIPGLGSEEYPGFPVDVCPDEMPDISTHHTIVAEVLTKDPSIYEKLKNTRTTSGVTLAKVIKPGIDNRGHAMIKTCGATAGDEESYATFSALFDPLICSRHGGFGAEHMHQSDFDFAKVDYQPIDPTRERVQSTRLKLVRNLRGFRFPSACSFDERREVERVATEALSELTQSFSGEYYPLVGSNSYALQAGGMSFDDEQRLQYSKLLFQEPDSGLLLSSGMGRDWPDARGVFATPSLDFAAWINEEDHLNLFVTQHGGLAKEAFERLYQMHSVLQAALQQQGHDFMHSDRLGFLTADPSNLGTGLRATITVLIPLLSTRPDFSEICRALQLTTKSASRGYWEISNTDRLGTSEVELMSLVTGGCRYLLELEAQLERGEPIVRPGLGVAPLPGFPVDKCPITAPKWASNRHIMGQVLRENPAIYSQLRSRRTAAGTSFSQVIKPGVDIKTSNHRVSMGLVAGDVECYTMFDQLFEPAIKAFHGSLPSGPHPSALDPFTVDSGKMDPTGKRVTAVCIRAARSLSGIRFPSACSFDERREVERALVRALEGLSGDLEGEYIPLAKSDSYPARPGGMSAEETKTLRRLGFFFQEPKAPALLAAGLGRDWPDARGVFLSQSEGLAAKVNEEEHLSLIARHKGDDMKAAFAKLCSSEKALQLALEQEGYAFARSDRLGFLTCSPERLGTALTVSVTLKAPALVARSDFSDLCASCGLTIASKGGGGVVEVANLATLGVSEAALVSGVADGVRRLLEAE